MKKLIFFVILTSLLACSKDKPNVMSLEDDVLNSIAGKWQYQEHWTVEGVHRYFADFDATKYDPTNFFEFNEDNTYNFSNSSGKIFTTSRFTITDVEKRKLEFKDWDFYFYVIADDHLSPAYVALITVKEIFIEEIDKDYLTIRCDKISQDGAVGPIYAKLRRAQP